MRTSGVLATPLASQETLEPRRKPCHFLGGRQHFEQKEIVFSNEFGGLSNFFWQRTVPSRALGGRQKQGRRRGRPSNSIKFLGEHIFPFPTILAAKEALGLPRLALGRRLKTSESLRPPGKPWDPPGFLADDRAFQEAACLANPYYF